MGFEVIAGLFFVYISIAWLIGLVETDWAYGLLWPLVLVKKLVNKTGEIWRDDD